MIETRPARFNDAFLLAPRLRFDDAREIASAWGVGAREGLLRCLLGSDRAFTLVEGDSVLALWGVRRACCEDLELGVPWLLAGEELFTRRRWLMQRSREWVDRLLLDYDALTNLTAEDNHAHLRWLEWCGFRSLRRHEGHGLDRRAFVEFYRVNDFAAPSPDAVRRRLLRRAPPPAGIPPLPVLDGLVAAALACLGPNRRYVAAAQWRDLFAAMERLCRDGDPGRLRYRGVELLAELAPRVATQRARRSCVVVELFEGLADLAETANLEPHAARLGDLLEALRPPSGQRSAAAGGARARPGGPGPMVLLRHLIAGCRHRLTLGGLVGPAQGYRLHTAALGRERGAANQPLGRSMAHLSSFVIDRHLRTCLRGSAGGDGLAAYRSLCGEALAHGTAMARMAARFDGASRLAAAVRAALDTVSAPELPRIETVGGAMVAAGVVADRVAAMLLPGVRLGGVARGCADHQWLSRLVRVALVVAGTGQSAPRLALLLHNEATALLLVARIQGHLLSGREPEQAAILTLHDVEALWGPGEGDPEQRLGTVVGLVMPTLLYPALNELVIEPVLLALDLVVTNGIEPCLHEMAEVFGDDGTVSRARFRNFLRRLKARRTTLALDQRQEPDDPNAAYVEPSQRRRRASASGGGPRASGLRAAAPAAAGPAGGVAAAADRHRFPGTDPRRAASGGSRRARPCR